MPIHDMHFANGIFFAREVGHINRADAELWLQQVRRYTAESPTPIVALIDAREVTHVAVQARRLFVIASKLPNFRVTAIAAKSVGNMQTSRIIGMMAERDHTHVFETFEEAYHFAVEQARAAQTY
jgi:hypothetical protein